MRDRSRWFFRVGALLVLLTAALHTWFHMQESPEPKSDAERQLFDLMKTVKLDLPGADRTMHELVDGFSLTMSVLLALVALLDLWFSVRDTSLRTVAAVNALGAAAMVVLSWQYFFLAPLVCFVLIFLAFAGSLLSRRAPAPVAPTG
jgi:hypothetical protein